MITSGNVSGQVCGYGSLRVEMASNGTVRLGDLAVCWIPNLSLHSDASGFCTDGRSTVHVLLRRTNAQCAVSADHASANY